jgi:RpiB/LacA/LacB family sugar-phosphate isomerase
VKVAVASDHAGFALKQEVADHVRGLGHEVVDLGTHSTDPVDYPDYAAKIAEAVRSGQVERGLLFCGSGIGASVAANKFPGVRAGNCMDHYSAHQGVEHDAMNVLVMGGRVVGSMVAMEMAEAFLKAAYTGEPRHARRLSKVQAIEDHFMKQG